MVSPRKDALDTDKIGSLLFKLTVPTVMAQLVSLLYNVVDRIFIGHIPEVGAMALTGVGITFPIIVLILAFTDLIGFGGAPKASIEMGRQNNDMAERILGNCFCNLILVSLILTFGIYGGLEPLLRMFGASNETLPYALDYLSIYLLGTIFIQVGIGLNNFISAQGYAKISMITVMVGAIVNIILDPIFIFGLDLGVKGAAIATVIAQGISAVWVLSFLAGKSTKWRIRKKYFRIEKKIMLSVLSLGMAPFVMKSTESLLTISFNISLQKYGGDLAVGAMTILATIKQMAFLPMTGICRGAQIGRAHV